LPWGGNGGPGKRIIKKRMRIAKSKRKKKEKNKISMKIGFVLFFAPNYLNF